MKKSKKNLLCPLTIIQPYQRLSSGAPGHWLRNSTSGLRRASSLRILAAKRGYVSKSIHTHKACWQWLKHVFPRPLFSSQTTPGWLFRVSFEMQSDISRQLRRECAHTEFQYPTRQDERVQHTDQTAYLKLAIVFLRASSDHHQVSHLRLAAQRLRIFEPKLSKAHLYF